MSIFSFLPVAECLERVGLVWQPEIGDEISQRKEPTLISILVDPQGMTPKELRENFIWLPTVEQLVFQVEARQAILFHAGLELTDSTMYYKTVIQATERMIEAKAESLRAALGLAVRDLLTGNTSEGTYH